MTFRSPSTTTHAATIARACGVAVGLLAGCASSGSIDEPSTSSESTASGANGSGGGGDGGDPSGSGKSSGQGDGDGDGGDGSGASGSSTSSNPTSSGSSGSPSSSSFSSSSGILCEDAAIDCPPSGSACLVPVCDGAACSTTNAASSTACDDAGGTICDGAGTCVACNVGPDCAGFPNTVCTDHQCVPATCTDAMLNGSEILTDCGGGTCPGCPDGTSCTQPVDCASAACVGSSCVACGGATQPCCPGEACDAAPYTCAANTTTLWGGTDSECNCGVLRAGQRLNIGDERWSCDGRFQLVMQGDSNLVLYYVGFGALWSSDTFNTGASYAILDDSGSFSVFDDLGNLWFSSFTSGISGGFLAVQDDGNVVVYDGGGTPWWSSNTCCY